MFFGFLAFLKLFGFPLFRLLVYMMKVISGVRVTRSLVLCVCFVERCLYFWPLCCLSFGLRILITSLWYLQTLRIPETASLDIMVSDGG